MTLRAPHRELLPLFSFFLLPRWKREADSSSHQDACGPEHLKNACTWQERAGYQSGCVLKHTPLPNKPAQVSDTRLASCLASNEDPFNDSNQARFESGGGQKGRIRAPPLLKDCYSRLTGQQSRHRPIRNTPESKLW